MIVVPDVPPHTTPPVPTVATEVVLLLHVPPEAASDNVVQNPGQICIVPVIGAKLNMVTVVVL